MKSMDEVLEKLADGAKEYPQDFTDWEFDFITSVSKQAEDKGGTSSLSTKQLEIILNIANSKGIES